MGLSTLNGHRVTSARATIPAWGRWYADVSIDVEATLTGAATLKIADLTLVGTVLTGGPAKGRSHFRIVAGAGGWGRTLPRKSYTNDAGVKLATVLGDAAKEAGEMLDLGARSADRVGPNWVRDDGPASRLLEQLASESWYIDEAGVTRLGRRPTVRYALPSTHGPLDLARRTVTIAAESIATILPGVVVEGIEACDVEHEVTPDGLRSTIWGATSTGPSRSLAAIGAILDQHDPFRKYRGQYEYRVVLRSDKRLDLQPVRVSTRMPDLRRVMIRPGVPGFEAEAAIGSRVLVGFVDADPSRPVVLAFEDSEGEGFVPDSVNVRAGGQVGGEHVMTVEACALLIYNTLVALTTAATPLVPLTAAGMKPFIGAAINVALAAQAIPAPAGESAQDASSAAQLAGFAAGASLAQSCEFFEAAIAGVATKTPNVSGHFPSIGAAAVETG